jgi:zinc transporter ZupT
MKYIQYQKGKVKFFRLFIISILAAIIGGVMIWNYGSIQPVLYSGCGIFAAGMLFLVISAIGLNSNRYKKKKNQ